MIFNVYTFWRTGPVVKVSAREDAGLFVIEAANIGRAPVDVNACGVMASKIPLVDWFGLPARRPVMPKFLPWRDFTDGSHPIPCRLDQGSSAQWELCPSSQWPESYGPWPPAVGYVELANGRQICSPPDPLWEFRATPPPDHKDPGPRDED